jgi:carbonic anhydrase/acetyltransferase-like protein (isoleucine patch superfamily)
LPHTIVPSGQLWAGNPAVYIRDVKEEEIMAFEKVSSVVFSLIYLFVHCN